LLNAAKGPPKPDENLILATAFSRFLANVQSVKKPLTPPLIEGHLKGYITIGAYALSAESQAAWICLDADDRDEWQGLLSVARQLSDQGVASYLELDNVSESGVKRN
jgi:hypothetical protein